jgi:hypothetical protein
MRKLYENFHIFHFQKRIVSVETIHGNTVCYNLVKGENLIIIKVQRILKGLGGILSSSGSLKKFEFLRPFSFLLRKPCFASNQLYIKLKTKSLLSKPSFVLPLQ